MSVAEHVLRTITVDGERLDALYDQWSPEHWVQLDDEIACLTFHDPISGHSAVWYLNADHAYCGSHIEVVQRLSTQDIITCISPWFDTLSKHSLATQPLHPESVPTIPPFLAIQLAGAWCVRQLNDLKQIHTSLIEQNQSLDGIEESGLTARQVRRLLATRIGPESLVVLSPFSDAPLRSQISFVVDHKLVHRFHDPEKDSAFYLAWWERQLDTPPIFYCPHLKIVIGDDGQAPLLPGQILGWYLSHPEHVTTIEQAHLFEARDYGLGQASSLLNDLPNEDASTNQPIPETMPSADMISESWALLHQPRVEMAPDLQNASSIQKKSDKLFERMRSLIQKK